eukprot:NODE_2799_length_1491_cov_39.614035_g2419_i0.p1 GENE.NODE_2799_length_1491_cov_39.614035_g2419_i0~~NODE_2799_length_1491_cov_39.614035_g2419_i0.p1  ORF type:complete len:390 (+),score=75.62 NODE_2799_length_1491_cov_39.614035_g2419_i0:125-1294(+)
MDPASEQLQNNMARMKAAAQARRSRPLVGMVSSTATPSDKRPNTATSATSSLSGSGQFTPSAPSITTPINSNPPLSSRTSSTSIGNSSISSRPNTGDEGAGAEQIRKQLERVGIAPVVDSGEDTLRKSDYRTEMNRLDLSDTRSFLGQPPPKVGMIQCYIVREKSALYGCKYCLYLEDNNMFLLTSVKRKKNKTSNYLISLDKEDLNRDSGHFYGKLRSNFVGTEFTVFDKGEKPGKDGAVLGVASRQECAGIVYERNLLGTKGPRKMLVLVPSFDETGRRSVWKPEKEEDGLIANFKNGNMSNMMTLKNKEPHWNEQLRAYVLNFGGRVTMASVKNFQLVDQENPNRVLVQFGKVEENKFSLDFQYPISGLQAFGIALSAFDSKLACE